MTLRPMREDRETLCPHYCQTGETYDQDLTMRQTERPSLSLFVKYGEHDMTIRYQEREYDQRSRLLTDWSEVSETEIKSHLTDRPDLEDILRDMSQEGLCLTIGSGPGVKEIRVLREYKVYYGDSDSWSDLTETQVRDRLKNTYTDLDLIIETLIDGQTVLSTFGIYRLKRDSESI